MACLCGNVLRSYHISTMMTFQDEQNQNPDQYDYHYHRDHMYPKNVQKSTTTIASTYSSNAGISNNKSNNNNNNKIKSDQEIIEEAKKNVSQHDRPTRQKKDGRAREARRRDRKYLERLFPGPTSLSLSPLSVPTWISCNDEHEYENEHESISRRILDDIQIHVMGWNRLNDFSSLLQSLQNANYQGYTQDIPLYIHVDGGSLLEVNALAESFEWNHGPKYLDLRQENIGLRQMWLTSMHNATRSTGDNTLMLILEDDMVISPYYFQWLLMMVDKYARHPECRDSNLVGFSLSPIVRQNMYKPFYKWSADEELQSYYLLPKDNQHHSTKVLDRHSAYLSTIPSSWGGAYFSDHWKRFHHFVERRSGRPFYFWNRSEDDRTPDQPWKVSPSFLHLPHDCMTKYWTASWKRFMVDFMYARGYYMLYPNPRNQQGLAYAQQSSGIHVNENNRNMYQVELLNDTNAWEIMKTELPNYQEMKLIDLEHQTTSREIAMAMGIQYLNSVHNDCVKSKLCPDLLQRWSREGATIPSKGFKAYPQICVADLYTSSATHKERPMTEWNSSGKNDEKFLLLSSNQLDIPNAKAMAKVLNRRLILTNSDKYHASDVEINHSVTNITNDLQHITDTVATAKVGKVIQINESISDSLLYSEDSNVTVHPWRILQLTQKSSSSKDVVTSSFWNKTGFSKMPVIPLYHLFDGWEVLKDFLVVVHHSLGGCSDKVLAINVGTPIQKLILKK